MIFVWGTKERRKAAGHVAEICPSCAAITAHRLTELREVPHVYYLPIGPGKVAGYQVECGPCAAVQGVDPARYTARLDAEIELAKLIELTHPGVHAELEEQKQREERARRGELTAEERVQVMQEALIEVTTAVETRAESGAIDARTGLCAVATLVLPWFLVLPGTAANSASGELLVYGGIVVGILGVLATIHARWTSLPRFIHRNQGEAIKGALGSYHPSPAELDLVLAGLRAAGTALGKRTDREWLTALFYSPAALSAEPIA